MADSSSPYVQAVFSETLLKLANAIGPTILVYDYALTFGREVELVWKSPRNTIKVVFLISRYLPFFDATVQLLYRNVLADPSPETCKYLIPTQVWLSIFGSNVSEFLFLLRTWAVWEKDRAVGIFLAVTTVTCLALGIYGSLEFLRSLTFVSGSNIGGCLVLSSSNMLLMDYSAFMVIEAVQLILMLIKSYANYRRERKISKLTRVVIRDGIMYYLVLFVLAVLNQTFTATSQLGILTAVLSLPTRAAHSIFAARMIFGLRELEEFEASRAIGETMALSTVVTFGPSQGTTDVGETGTARQNIPVVAVPV